jgi:hypothetical protein
MNMRSLVLAFRWVFLRYPKIQKIPQPQTKMADQFVSPTSVFILTLSNTPYRGTSIHNRSLQNLFCQSPCVVKIPYIRSEK